MVKKQNGGALIETVLILGILFSLIYYEKEAIKLSRYKLEQLQKKRISYDGEKQ